MRIIEYPTGVALEERVGGGGSNDIHSSCDQRLWFSTIRESICVMEKFKFGDENIDMAKYKLFYNKSPNNSVSFFVWAILQY